MGGHIDTGTNKGTGTNTGRHRHNKGTGTGTNSIYKDNKIVFIGDHKANNDASPVRIYIREDIQHVSAILTSSPFNTPPPLQYSRVSSPEKDAIFHGAVQSSRLSAALLRRPTW